VATLRRVVVVGTTGSGKTTLARTLAQRLNAPHVELDALHWEPNWQPASSGIFRERTAQALVGESWVVDGNYSLVRDITWERADTIVWLDYALPLILARLTRRTFWRIATRVELWNGNHERLRATLLTRDSILVWALTTYRRRKRDYSSMQSEPRYAHLAVVRLRSPRAARQWLAAVRLPTPNMTAAADRIRL
jgi:adenylate kinase family enzyme